MLSAAIAASFTTTLDFFQNAAGLAAAFYVWA